MTGLMMPPSVLLFTRLGLLLTMGLTGSTARPTDTCQWETFNATCQEDEVIVIKNAEYGRMELGRCLLQSYGYIGCGKDVKPYLDSKCSGRHKCGFTIPDPVLDKVQPCPGDLKAYLDASYTCLKVSRGEGHMCRGSSHVKLTEPRGFIASVVTEDLQLGSSMCPWLIQAQPGQRIVITLLDFALWSMGRMDRTTRHRPETSGICHIYANIRENTNSGSITVCGGDQRERTIYTSETESVQIEVANMKLSKTPAYFVFKYEMVGCPSPPKSAATLVERSGTSATVTCHATGEKWDIHCEDGQWKGKPHNCTEAKAWGLTSFIEGAISLPQGLLIALIIGIALFIAVVILAVGLWSLKRRRTDQAAGKGKGLLPSTDTNHYARRSVAEAGKENYPMLANQDRYPMERDGEYTSTWHRRAAVPATHAPQAMLPPPPPCPPDGYMRSDYDSGYRTSSYSYADDTEAFRPPRVEHIYESPKFLRRGHTDNDSSDGPFYHELDPDKSSEDGGNISSHHPDLLPFDSSTTVPQDSAPWNVTSCYNPENVPYSAQHDRGPMNR